MYVCMYVGRYPSVYAVLHAYILYLPSIRYARAGKAAPGPSTRGGCADPIGASGGKSKKKKRVKVRNSRWDRIS